MELIGKSPAFVRACGLIMRFARCDVPVLIEGATGTGKELAARQIHYGGTRGPRPFIAVNCGAIPDTLLESELFGHRRGAFTDAKADRPGLVELANGGTLFLDEIDSLSPRGQVALLRFLQDFEYTPLGANAVRRADIRVVSASNQSLSKLAESSRFRVDLLYRLQILHVRLPSLSERPGDAALLARHFVARIDARLGNAGRTLDAASLGWLSDYDWPGNVRELENLVYRAFVLTDAPKVVLSPEYLVGATHEAPSPEGRRPRSFHEAKREAIVVFERSFLTDLLARSNGNVSTAARLAGTERRTLGKLIKKHGIDRGRFA